MDRCVHQNKQCHKIARGIIILQLPHLFLEGMAFSSVFIVKVVKVSHVKLIESKLPRFSELSLQGTNLLSSWRARVSVLY